MGDTSSGSVSLDVGKRYLNGRNARGFSVCRIPVVLTSATLQTCIDLKKLITYLKRLYF